MEHVYMKLNNKIKLLALDVDGTLFDDAGHIPEQNIRAIQKSGSRRDRGGRFRQRL